MKIYWRDEIEWEVWKKKSRYEFKENQIISRENLKRENHTIIEIEKEYSIDFDWKPIIIINLYAKYANSFRKIQIDSW